MKINQIIMFCVFVLISMQMFAQETTETKQDKKLFMGFNDNRDVYFQFLVGSGFSFYKMKNDEDLINFLQDANYKINDMNGGLQFNLGVAAIIKNPELRILFDYRRDGYGNVSVWPSPMRFSFSFFGSESKSYELDHSITTFSLGAEKLIFFSEEKNSYLGIGGSYLWITDERNEKVSYEIGGKSRNSENTLSLDAKALQIQASFGSLLSGKLFVEARLAYQFQQSFKFDSASKKPGRSALGYEPNFNSFTFKFMFGVML